MPPRSAAEVRRWSEAVRTATVERNRAIRKMRNEGASLRAIGKEADLSYAAIRKICLRDEE